MFASLDDIKVVHASDPIAAAVGSEFCNHVSGITSTPGFASNVSLPNNRGNSPQR